MWDRNRIRQAILLLFGLLVGLVLAATVIADVIPGADGATPIAGASGSYAPTHAIIHVKPDVIVKRTARGSWKLIDRSGRIAAANNSRSLRAVRRREARLSNLLAAADARSIEPLLNFEPANPDLARRLGLDRYYRIELPAAANAAQIVEQLKSHNTLVERAELDGVGGVAQVIPDDPSFGLLYGMHNTGQSIRGASGTPDADIDAPEAWQIHTGGGDIILAVIDSGVNPHVEFASKMIAGWNTNDESSDTSDPLNHGTHVTGTAGAIGDNGTGVAGVSWGVSIMPMRVLNSSGAGTETQCANAIIRAADAGANVGTMSLQYYIGTSYFHNAVRYGYESGMVLVAATGNSQGNIVAFPARWPETIAVGATDNRDQHAPFSNYGPQISVAAPGVNVYSTVSTSSYTYASGTSMATPHVAGLACLMWSLDPSLTNDEIRAIIEATADDLGSAGFDEFHGFGRINARAALQAVLDGMNSSGATLTDIALVTGTILDGTVDDLRTSDDSYLHTRSGFGRTIVDLHNMEMIVSAATAVDSPALLDLTVESRIGEPSGSARLGLFNWTTSSFDPVAAHAIGTAEETITIQNLDATDYVSANGMIDLSIKHIVFVPFMAFTFESFIDRVEIAVE